MHGGQDKLLYKVPTLQLHEKYNLIEDCNKVGDYCMASILKCIVSKLIVISKFHHNIPLRKIKTV